MSELRWAPVAVVIWVVLAAPFPYVLAAALVVAAACVDRGQALLMACGAVAGGIVKHVRERPLPDEYLATVISTPRLTRTGSWMVELSGPGVAPHVVFLPELGDIQRHSPVQVVGGDIAWHGAGSDGKEAFRELVLATVSPASQGLLPGMVLGDTSLQSAAEQDAYIATGLSHLSAVSGSNVVIVTSTVALACRALGIPPKGQVAAALVALAGFVYVVGPEPSVLRASVAGLAALLAVVGDNTMPALHALSLGVAFLLLWRSDLATNVGFALSVAATAGIVVLFPVLYRGLAPLQLPDALTRAIAVSLAAEMATAFIVAGIGEVPVFGVLANVLVAPATWPITVLGVAAAAIQPLCPPLAALLLKIVDPLSWYIYHLANGIPHVTVQADPAGTALFYGWVLAFIMVWHYKSHDPPHLGRRRIPHRARPAGRLRRDR